MSRGRARPGLTSADSGDLLGENPVGLPIEFEVQAEIQVVQGVKKHPGVVQGVPVKDIEFQGNDRDIPETRVVEDLPKTVFRKRIVVVEVLGQGFGARDRVGPVEGVQNQGPVL